MDKEEDQALDEFGNLVASLYDFIQKEHPGKDDYEKLKTSTEVLEAYVSIAEGRWKRQITGLVEKLYFTTSDLCEKLNNLKVTRAEVSTKDKNIHQRHLNLELNRRCPCCLKIKKTFQVDHFRDRDKPDLVHTWPICTDCHNKFTQGKEDKEKYQPEFIVYQKSLSLFVDPQRKLFEQ